MTVLTEAPGMTVIRFAEIEPSTLAAAISLVSGKSQPNSGWVTIVRNSVAAAKSKNPVVVDEEPTWEDAAWQ